MPLSIAETVRDRGLIPKDYQQEMAYGESNGHLTDGVTWPWKVRLVSRDPNTLRAQYLENSWRCYLATISNYRIVCCEAVRSAILATAWLLVTLRIECPLTLSTCQLSPLLYNPYSPQGGTLTEIAAACLSTLRVVPCRSKPAATM